jgi:hypothetical protein
MVTVGAGRPPAVVAKNGVGELNDPGTQLTEPGLGLRQEPYWAPGMYSLPLSVVTVLGRPVEAERDNVGVSWLTVKAAELTIVEPDRTTT